MSTLQELRDKVRIQTDLDVTDLPDPTLDGFLLEAFQATMAADAKWPFLETTWNVSFPAGAETATLPTGPDIAFIVRARSPQGWALLHLAHHIAEDAFAQDTFGGEPEYYSLWGGTMYLWPIPTDTTSRTVQVRGFRKPTWSGVAATEIDGPEELHLAMFHYAVSLAYAQLEDPEQEANYMRRWSQLVDAHRRNIGISQQHTPLILNGGIEVRTSRNGLNLVV